MKRCWFGGGLLLFLLVSGLLLSLYLSNFHWELSETMGQAAALAGKDREQALQKTEEAQSQWERRRFLSAVLSDHAPMEQIEENFALLTPDAEEEDFRETCLRLSAQLKTLSEGQMLTLENLL